MPSLDVLLRGLGFALAKGVRAEVVVKVEMGAGVAALLERAVLALEGRGTAAVARAAMDDGQDRQPGGSSSPAPRAPSPAPVAEAGAGGATAGEPPAPPSPPDTKHEASLAKARAARWSGETWLTPERAEAFQAGWEAGEEVHALGARLAEMPGPEVPGIRALAQKAWVKGWKRPPGYKPLIGRPAPRVKGAGPAWQTPERLAEMRRLVAEELASWPRVTDVLSAMDGPPMPQFRQSVRRWALENGIEPPARPVAGWRTPGRAEVLRRDWLGGVSAQEIKDAMALLPGLPMPYGVACVGNWAAEMELRRPAGHVGVVVGGSADFWAEEGRGEELARRWQAGETLQELMAHFGRSMGAIQRQVRKQGLKLRKAAPPRKPSGGAPMAVRPAVAERAPVMAAVPRAVVAPTPVAPRLVPRLPAPSNGVHHCSYREIQEWAARFGIIYNGANGDAVNKRRKLMGLLPVVQDEARTAADVRVA